MRRIGIACVLVGAVALAGCSWTECAMLCRRVNAVTMTNPKTGEHVKCMIKEQKDDVSDAELRKLSTCVRDNTAKGFAVDR